MRCQVVETAAEIGCIVAQDIARRMKAVEGARKFLLGCPGGRSARPIYAALARQQLDLSGLIIVMMDEYLVQGATGFSCVSDSAHYSCRRFAREEIAAVLNAGRDHHDRLPADNLWQPDPTDPLAYDARIASEGGIDMFILACGAGDGHVAFNPPGSARDSRTRIVTLAEQTRRDNMATFPDFRSLDEVPRHGITVGIGTIADQSRAVAMVLWGADKRYAWQHLGNAAGYDAQWPASIVAECADAVLYVDSTATA